MANYLLSVDPGYTTGFALFDGQGDLVVSDTSESPHTKLRATVSLMTADHPDLCAVVEKSPPQRKFNDMSVIRPTRIIEEFVSNIQYVRPSQWKNHPMSRLEATDRPSVIHESDAIRIGRWFIRTNGVTDNDERSSSKSPSSAD